MTIQLCHKALAECHDLTIRFALRIKIAAALSAAERHKNVEQFSAAPVSLEGMRVLLCDDVLTTGSTMNRCAALLKAQGAAEVAAISMTTTAMKSPSKEPTHG